MNMCISLHIFPIYIQPKQDSSIPEEDNNILNIFEPHEDDKLEVQDIERDYRNLVDESLGTSNYTRDGLSKHTL